MKQQIINFILLALLTMALPFESSGTDKVVDFNFPKDVSENALADLNQALKSGDGQLTVDALVRYSIAQSSISKDNMADIIEKIESVAQKEKRPEFKALLYHLEALAYQGYRNSNGRWRNRNNPVEETPTDISEWDYNQFNRKILQLVNESLQEGDALKRVPVKSLPGIIKCNDLGATFVPTLFEFLSIKGAELIDDIDEMRPMKSLIEKEWLKAVEGNAPAHIYALIETDQPLSMEIYEKYKDSEFSAMLLEELCEYSNSMETYNTLKDWVARFPKSMYAPNIKNMITSIEEKSVHVKYPCFKSTRDSIPIEIDVKNANTFYINVYSVPENLLDKYRQTKYTLNLVKQVPVNVAGTVPFKKDGIKMSLPPLPHGAYILCGDDLTGDRKEKTEVDLYNYDIMRVTDLALFTVSRIDNKNHIGAVDIKTGQPQQGVTVHYNDQRSTTGIVGKTGTNGLVSPPDFYMSTYYKREVPFDKLAIHGERGTDIFGQPIHYYLVKSNDVSNTTGKIYTDLGVYRPGETVQWAFILYNTQNAERQPVEDKKVQIVFKDQNREPIDTLKASTDAWGRIEGSFVVPKDRMNGVFSITVSTIDEAYNRQLATQRVNVSEYKLPTFAVTFPDERRSYTIGQPVKVTGKAETYSGMPVANTQVRLSLIQHEWHWGWWHWKDVSGGTHLMDTTVTTDEKGMFSFSYDPALFYENKPMPSGRYRWSHYNYQVQATVTTDAGETQEESTNFIVGTRRGIELGAVDHGVFLNDKPIKLPITYNTTDEEHPSTWCTWKVETRNSDNPVKTGNFNTDNPIVDLTDLPSGEYFIKVHILDADKGEEDVDDMMSIVLYRKADKVPPVKDTPLWIPRPSMSVDKNNVGHVAVGVSVPKAYIYHIASTNDGDILSEGWLNYSRGMHDFTVALPKKAGTDVEVNFICYYEAKAWSDNVTLTNPYKPEALKITATSFRDKLVPGDIEHWTFSLTDQNGKPRQGAMLLAMYDKAISAIADNKWGFTNWRHIVYPVQMSNSQLGGNKYTSSTWKGRMLDINDDSRPEIPELWTYGQTLFGYYMSTSEALLSETGRPMLMKSAMPMTEEVAEDAYLSRNLEDTNSAAMGSKEEEAQVDENNLEKVILRESDIKVALWQPMLTSDDKGNIQLEFEAPNFNTTWITQAVAWDKKMLGNTWMAEVLTQKPLMVRSSLPRFLRQGDVATLAATVQNATDAAAACDAVIELFDPRSGDIYATRKFNLQLDPMGSQAVTIDWTVPDSIAFAGFRIKAANDRYGDGEQVMVPVLTTISPVIETEPFYIEAAQNHFEATLPHFPNDARVTLEYCDNPTWYCVLALPTIFSDNYQISTEAAHSLYAMQVAQGVAKGQPQIKEAIDYWKQHNEDSALVSMLQKNQDLKIGTLLASPWMRDADRQTLRMSKLYELFDENLMSKEYEKIISALQSLQMGDGGFTWFRHPDCKSSVWATQTVLELIGEIKHLGFLPDDNRLSLMTKRALEYYDNENVLLFNDMRKYNKKPYASFSTYAYVSSLYPEANHSKASADLLKNTLKFMDKNWDKGLSLKKKAFYSMTLNRNGYKKTAQRIVESIRQFAIVKPTTGMYWDNLQTGYGWWEFDKVAYTSVILQAMNEIDPRKEEIDQIRKWMLLMKQSNDWGSGSLASDAVYSILSTGSQWLERNGTPAITVAGQPLKLDKMAEWLGYFRTSLSAATTGNVVIDRNGSSPAWGAIYSQFKAPMTQIKEKAIEEVSISKEYYLYAQDGSLHQATSFKVGDKVKVRLVIKVNKDMDYVTITDERAACFEPVDQLSGYRAEDRTWFYQETKDTQTNVFVNSLDKGTHIIGYDVWVTNPGKFTSGIATIQCQYAPQLSAHSAGKSITIDGK